MNVPINRTCYIAPERFVKTLTSEPNNTLFPEQELKKGDLNPMMDIFSAGCALTELYNEGHPPFDFSQLLGKLLKLLKTSNILFYNNYRIIV